MQVSGTHNAVSQVLRRLPRPQAPAQLLYPDRVHVCAEPRKEPRGRPEGAAAAGKRAAEPQEGEPLPRKRGRPLGSRHKPKPATPAQPAAPVPKKEAAPVDKKDAAPVSKKKATPVPRKKAAPVPKKKAALAPADAAAPTPKKRGRPPGSPNKVKKVCPRTCPYLTAGLHTRSFLAWLSPKHCWAQRRDLSSPARARGHVGRLRAPASHRMSYDAWGTRVCSRSEANAWLSIEKNGNCGGVAICRMHVSRLGLGLRSCPSYGKLDGGRTQ